MSRTRYPGYDVLDKRDTLSWDAVTRRVIDERLAIPSAARYLDAATWLTLQALCARIVPQPRQREAIPVAGMLDERMRANAGDGYRDARLPPWRDAWRIGLAAIDEESIAAFGAPFATLGERRQDALIGNMQRGKLTHPAWQNMPADLFFEHRVLKDICSAYYSHPQAWSEIGFGGPANPRGYVRMYFDRRDPWEPVEAKPGEEARARKDNRRVR